MNDQLIINILKSIAVLVLDGKGAFFVGDRQDGSWYSSHANHPIIQVLPWKHTQAKPDVDPMTINLEMYFIGNDPVTNLAKDTFDVIYEMGDLKTKFFDTLSKWTIESMFWFEYFNFADEQLFKQYAASLTGYRVTFSLRFNVECSMEEYLQVMDGYLLQENMHYILQENGGLIRIT